MSLNFSKIFIILICCFLFSCQSEHKPAPAAASVPAAPIPGSVATPSNISRPDVMTNNYQRMQGEWQHAEMSERKLYVLGNRFLLKDDNQSDRKPARHFKMVKDCDGEIDDDGTFFMVDNQCYKLLRISIEEMEVEVLDQQKVTRYVRI